MSFLKKFRQRYRTPGDSFENEVWRQAALFRLSAALAAPLEEEEICRAVVKELHDTLGYDYIAFFILDEESGKRYVRANIGFEESPKILSPGEGLSERPFLDGQLHYSPDITQEPRYVYGAGGAEVDVPVRIAGEVRAALVAERTEIDSFDEHDFKILTAAAHLAGLALEKARLLARERKRAEELEVLRTTMADITAELELSTLLNDIVERAAGLLNATGGELGLYDEQSGEIEIVVSYNLGGDYIGTRHTSGEGAMGHVLKTGKPLVLEDYSTWEGSLASYESVHATLAVPLDVGGRLVGVFTTVSSDRERRFSPADLHLLQLFAHQAAIMIQNARLFDQAQTEIQEREKFEQEITRQKEYFEALLVNNPVAVVTADLMGKIVSWNPMAEKLFGYTAEEVIGEALDDVVADHDLVREEAARYTEQVMNEGRVQATTKRPRKDGSFVDVELLALPVTVACESMGFIAIYHDITEVKRIERELRKQKEYFESLFLNNPVAVVTTDLDGKVISWNPTAERMFGYSESETVGKRLSGVISDDIPASLRDTREFKGLAITETGRAFTKRARKDGSIVDVEIKALPVMVGDEKVGDIVIYIDITELQEARRQAEAANRAKSTFLANMSHELRTPLNAILGFTQLMDRDRNLTESQRENLGIINQSGEHLLDLINDVLEMSKIEAGRIKLQQAGFELPSLLEGLEEIFVMRAQRKGLELAFELPDDLPRYVKTDEGKLRQVIVNLLDNAIKFTGQGSVILRAKVAHKQDDGEPRRATLHFAVEDTGRGIEPEEIDRVFEPFVQAISGQMSHEGTGLGLTICRQYVELLGGVLSIESEVGRGTVATFDVQLDVVDESEVKSAHPVRHVMGIEPDQPEYRLLVVEDRDSNRRLLVNILKPLGFEVREATNGEEALALWKEFNPHLIWMDIQLPDKNGLEVTRQIKNTPEGKRILVIALTASAFEEDRERVLSGGCDDFVRKPFRPNEIYEVLAKHLDVRFIYEEDEPEASASEPAERIDLETDALTVEIVNELPERWLDDLTRAIIEADITKIQNLIDLLNPLAPRLADRMTDLARSFEYESLQRIIEAAGKK